MATKKKKAASTTAKKKTTTTAKKATGAKKKSSATSAFMAPMKATAHLAAVIGDKPMPRTEVVKKLWAYIRKHNLQDPKNKRNIRADEALAKVFGGKEVVSMFEMTKLVNKHLSATA